MYLNDNLHVENFFSLLSFIFFLVLGFWLTLNSELCAPEFGGWYSYMRFRRGLGARRQNQLHGKQKKKNTTAPSLLHSKRWKHILLGGIEPRWLEQPDGWSRGIPKAEKSKIGLYGSHWCILKKGGWFFSLFKHQHIILSFAKYTKGWFKVAPLHPSPNKAKYSGPMHTD